MSPRLWVQALLRQPSPTDLMLFYRATDATSHEAQGTRGLQISPPGPLIFYEQFPSHTCHYDLGMDLITYYFSAQGAEFF